MKFNKNGPMVGDKKRPGPVYNRVRLQIPTKRSFDVINIQLIRLQCEGSFYIGTKATSLPDGFIEN